MSYSRRPTLFEIIKEKFFKRTNELENKGWFKTLSGKWHNGHYTVLNKKEAMNYMI